MYRCIRTCVYINQITSGSDRGNRSPCRRHTPRNTRPFFNSYLVSVRRRPVIVSTQLNFNKVSVPTTYAISTLIELAFLCTVRLLIPEKKSLRRIFFSRSRLFSSLSSSSSFKMITALVIDDSVSRGLYASAIRARKVQVDRNIPRVSARPVSPTRGECLRNLFVVITNGSAIS